MANFDLALGLLPGHWSQADRLLRLHTVLDAEKGPDVLIAEVLEGTEGISLGSNEPDVVNGHRMTGFKLQLGCLSLDAHLDLKALIAQPVLLELLTDQSRTELRPFHGYVTQCELVGANAGMARYQMTIEPWSAFLRHRRDSVVYQDMNVFQILESVFKDYEGQGKLVPQWRMDIKDTSVYPTYSLCTQYQETDLAFVERLMAQEGLFFWFEHKADLQSPGLGGHTLVIADHNGAFHPNARDTIEFTQPGTVMQGDSIDRWRSERRWQTNAVELVSWDYRQCSTRPISAHSDAHNSSDAARGMVLASTDVPGAYAYESRAHGQRIADNQLQALEARNKTFTGAGTVRTMSPGTTFVLQNHPGSAQDQSEDDSKFVVLQVTHLAHNNLSADLKVAAQQALGPASPGAGEGAQDTPSGLDRHLYRNRLEAIRSKIPYRASSADQHGQLLHPKPTVQGQQTAVVVGPPGKVIHTDRDHRVKVQFHWQRGDNSHSRLPHPHPDGQGGAPADDQAGTWVRVIAGFVPTAGANWGGQGVPRIGQEVLVDFLEGDIDRPVVIGAVYNGQGNSNQQHNKVTQGAGAAVGGTPTWFPSGGANTPPPATPAAAAKKKDGGTLDTVVKATVTAASVAAVAAGVVKAFSGPKSSLVGGLTAALAAVPAVASAVSLASKLGDGALEPLSNAGVGAIEMADNLATVVSASGEKVPAELAQAVGVSKILKESSLAKSSIESLIKDGSAQDVVGAKVLEDLAGGGAHASQMASNVAGLLKAGGVDVPQELTMTTKLGQTLSDGVSVGQNFGKVLEKGVSMAEVLNAEAGKALLQGGSDMAGSFGKVLSAAGVPVPAELAMVSASGKVLEQGVNVADGLTKVGAMQDVFSGEALSALALGAGSGLALAGSIGGVLKGAGIPVPRELAMASGVGLAITAGVKALDSLSKVFKDTPADKVKGLEKAAQEAGGAPKAGDKAAGDKAGDKGADAKKPGDSSHGAVLSGLKSQSMSESQAGTGGYNQLVFDDSPGKSRIGLQNHDRPHEGSVELNLGHLRHQTDNQILSPVGYGFEVKTTYGGALRAGAGLLLTTDPRQGNASGASSPQLDSNEALTQVEASHALQKTLAATAQLHQAKLTKEEKEAEKLDAIARTMHDIRVLKAKSTVGSAASIGADLLSTAGDIVGLIAATGGSLPGELAPSLALGTQALKAADGAKSDWSTLLDDIAEGGGDLMKWRSRLNDLGGLLVTGLKIAGKEPPTALLAATVGGQVLQAFTDTDADGNLKSWSEITNNVAKAFTTNFGSSKDPVAKAMALGGNVLKVLTDTKVDGKGDGDDATPLWEKMAALVPSFGGEEGEKKDDAAAEKPKADTPEDKNKDGNVLFEWNDKLSSLLLTAKGVSRAVASSGAVEMPPEVTAGLTLGADLGKVVAGQSPKAEEAAQKERDKDEANGVGGRGSEAALKLVDALTVAEDVHKLFGTTGTAASPDEITAGIGLGTEVLKAIGDKKADGAFLFDGELGSIDEDSTGWAPKLNALGAVAIAASKFGSPEVAMAVDLSGQLLKAFTNTNDRGVLDSISKMANNVGGAFEGVTKDKKDPVSQVMNLAGKALKALTNEGTDKTPFIVNAIQAVDGVANGRSEGGTVPAYSEPRLQLSSPAGIAAATPKNAILNAGTHVSVTAAKDIFLAVQGNSHHVVGKGVSLFTYGKVANPKLPNHATGITLQAANGKFSMQSQSDATKFTADKLITVASVAQDVHVAGKQHVLLTAMGGMLRIEGGNISLHGPGTIAFKASQKELAGPKSSSFCAQLPAPAEVKGCAESLKKASASQSASVRLT